MRGFRLLGMVLWLSYASLSQAATGFSVQNISCSGTQATIIGDVTGPLSIGCDGSLSLIGGSIHSDTSIMLAADETLTLVDLTLSAPQIDLSGASIYIGSSVDMGLGSSVDMELRPTAPVGGGRPTPGGMDLLAGISAGGQVTLHGGGGSGGGNLGSTGIAGSISLRPGGTTVNGGLVSISAGGQITLHGGGGSGSGNPGSTGIAGSISLRPGGITVGGGSGDSSITVIPSIPEPSTFAIMLCGLAALASRLRSARTRRL